MTIRVAVDTNFYFYMKNSAVNQSQNADFTKAANDLRLMHQNQLIELRGIIASASEEKYSLEEFQKGLRDLRLQHIENLPIPMILGFSYLGHSVIIDEAEVERIDKIFSLLFSGQPSNYGLWLEHIRKVRIGDQPDMDPKFRKNMCDVQMIWGFDSDMRRNIRDIGRDIDIFVSAETRFVRHYDNLAKLLNWDTNYVKIYELREAPTKIQALLEA